MIDINDQYGVAEKQRVLLSMAKDFHSFCVKNNICYSVIGGTLLGAIREQGFIPWDDDIDILMDRRNFELLMKASQGWEQYVIDEPLWVYKVVDKATFQHQGIEDDTPVLDIFIVDRVPAGKVGKKIKILGLKFLQGMMKTKLNEKKDFSLAYRLALVVTRIAGKPFSIKRKQQMYTRLSIWGNKNINQPFMICNDIFQSLDCEYDTKLMDGYSMINFEDTKLMRTNKWDDYLREQYGDYMKPVRTQH